jgi:hypothetical protein
LKYDLDHLETLMPHPTCTGGAHDLVITATNFFGDEDQRRDALKRIINTLVGKEGKFPGEVGKEAKPDGLWVEGPFAYLVFELKNEPGLGGDPFLQGLATYGKIVKQDEVSFLTSRL